MEMFVIFLDHNLSSYSSGVQLQCHCCQMEAGSHWTCCNVDSSLLVQLDSIHKRHVWNIRTILLDKAIDEQ